MVTPSVVTFAVVTSGLDRTFYTRNTGRSRSGLWLLECGPGREVRAMGSDVALAEILGRLIEVHQRDVRGPIIDELCCEVLEANTRSETRSIG